MKTKITLLLAVCLPIIFLDQATKYWIEQTLPIFHSIQIVQHFFHITHIQNSGGAFGVFSGLQSPHFHTLFILITVLAVGFIGFLYWKLPTHQSWPAMGLALVIGGAIGNLADRIRLGKVTDFIDVHFYSHHWPAFNIADSAITTGSVILGICLILKKW